MQYFYNNGFDNYAVIGNCSGIWVVDVSLLELIAANYLLQNYYLPMYNYYLFIC